VSDDLDESRAPLLDHLLELRRRLLYCVASVAVAFFVCCISPRTFSLSSFNPCSRSGRKR